MYLSELLASLFGLLLCLIDLSLPLLVLVLGCLLHPFDPLLGELRCLCCCLLEKLDVVVEPLFRQTETLASCPGVHIETVAKHLGHSFLEVEKLGERHLCRLSHRLHTLSEGLLIGLFLIGLELILLTHVSSVTEGRQWLYSVGSTDGNYFGHGLHFSARSKRE